MPVTKPFLQDQKQFHKVVRFSRPKKEIKCPGELQKCLLVS